MIAASLEGDGTLSLTDGHWFSVVSRYPGITFNAKKEEDTETHDVCPTLNVHSSPVSAQAEDGDQSRISTSTAQTTPLRSSNILQHQNPAVTPTRVTVAAYSRVVREIDLPAECRLCYESLAQSIGSISAGLAPSTSGRYRINNTYFTDQCLVLLRDLKPLVDRTKEQIKQISHLESFLIFKTIPDDSTLWAVYRQRAQLIIRLAAFPSASEEFLISQLGPLFNSAIYRPCQPLYDDDEIEPATMEILNTLYDLFFTWSTAYHQWCQAMQDLKQKYMLPLITRMVASNVLLAELKDMQRAKGKAETALVNPVAPRMLPMDERTVAALNLSARRKDLNGMLKRKARFRREKTI